jgi:MerR family transcriptional regulator, light-induced transcriptional regulator
MNQPDKPGFVPEVVYHAYLRGLLAHDRRQCRASFQQWLEADTGLRSTYEDLVRRSLYEVGDLWERGRISVATEHLVTAISESLLNLTYSRLFAQPRNGKSAVITCVPNEYHQIGGKMVADVFELNGWRGYFLGANTPVGEAITLIAEKRPEVVALSVATTFGLAEVVSAAAQIRAAFPEVAILVGGQAFRWGGKERVERLPGVRCLTSLGELEAWIKEHGNHV